MNAGNKASDCEPTQVCVWCLCVGTPRLSADSIVPRTELARRHSGAASGFTTRLCIKTYTMILYYAHANAGDGIGKCCLGVAGINEKQCASSVVQCRAVNA